MSGGATGTQKTILYLMSIADPPLISDELSSFSQKQVYVIRYERGGLPCSFCVNPRTVRSMLSKGLLQRTERGLIVADKNAKELPTTGEQETK